MEVPESDEAWAAQLGPVLTAERTAGLLGLSADEVRQTPGLLRVVNRDGHEVYPVIQFDAGQQIPGVADVVRELRDALLPLTVAAWLTAPNRALQGARPVDRLRSGDVERVRSLARQLAASTRI